MGDGLMGVLRGPAAGFSWREDAWVSRVLCGCVDDNECRYGSVILCLDLYISYGSVGDSVRCFFENVKRRRVR